MLANLVLFVYLEVSDEIGVPDLGVVNACLLFAVSSGHAVCYELAFKLEKDKKEKNIDQILAYGQCVKAEQRARVGKWVCQVSSTAGMKLDEQRRVISDRIKPANEKFFVTIKEVSDTEKRMRCDGSEYGLIDNLDGSHANRCLINYDVEFSPSMGNFSARPTHTTFSANMGSSRCTAQTISRSLREKQENSLSRWELAKNWTNPSDCRCDRRRGSSWSSTTGHAK